MTGSLFAGYTGDCAATGRTLMTDARTCGATFDPIPDVPAAAARGAHDQPAKGRHDPRVRRHSLRHAGLRVHGELPDGSSGEAATCSRIPGITFARYTGECAPERPDA